MKPLTLKQRIALTLNHRLVKGRRKEHHLQQLFWECTWRCNLACRHCGSDCKSSSTLPDMPVEDFIKVVDSILPHVDPHKLNIVITGGEPLVRTDLEKAGRMLYDRELPWGIVTNGLLLSQDRLSKLRGAGIHNLTVSLDGLQDTHNWMRRHPDSFAKALGAIRMVAKADDLNFDVVSCVNRRSLPELPELRDLLIDSGVRNWRLFTIFPTGRAVNYPEFELTEDEVTRLMDFIVETREEGYIKASFCCEGFMAGYEGKIRDYFYECHAGMSVASVLLDGGIGACPSIRSDFRQGNIYNDNFWDVWEHRFEIYRDRGWMKTGKCADCTFWRYCEGNGMHLRDSSGDLMHCHIQR